MTSIEYRSRAKSRRFGIVLSVAGLLTIAAPRAFAAVQQDLFAFHLGFQLGAAPQVDGNGNMFELTDFGVTNLVKFGPDSQVVWEVPMPDATVAGHPEAFLSKGCHILIDASNNIYVDSIFDDRAVNSTVVVTKFNSNGTVAWGGPKAFSNGPVNASEHNAAGPMAIGSDGSLYVVSHSGMLSPPTPQPTTLLRIDPATGAERNRRTVAATTDFTIGMGDTALTTDGAGNVYYGGPQGLWSFSQDLQTQRWASPLMPRALVVGAGNSALYLTGVGVVGSLRNMLVARLATSNGATVWNWSSGNESHPFPYPDTTFNTDDRTYGGNKILLDSAGQVYAAGHGLDGTYNGGIIVKLDQTNATRTPLWLKHYGPSNTGAAVFAFTADSLNDIYVSGQYSNLTGALADRMILSPVDGSQLWVLSNFNFAHRTITHESVDHVVVDGNGNTYWESTEDSSDQGDTDDLYQFRGPAVSDATYTLVALQSGMALDDPGSSHSAGLQMDQWTVNNGANQKWALTNLGNNTVRLVNQASGLSLGVRAGSTGNGAAVEQNVWTGGTNQKWIVTATNTFGYFTLKNVKSGQMLDVAGGSTATGALIDQWPANGGNNQKWHLQ